MCLVIDRNTPLQKANYDIICYKVLHESLTSVNQSFQYEIGEKYKTDFSINTKGCPADHIAADKYPDYVVNDYVYIQKGFHSYRNIRRMFDTGYWPRLVVNMKRSTFTKLIVVRCIIPKGALYYEDETGLLCSNEIRVIKKVKNHTIERS